MKVEDLVRGQRVKVTFEDNTGKIVTTDYIDFEGTYSTKVLFKYNLTSILSIEREKIQSIKQ